MDKPTVNLKTPYTTPPAPLSVAFVDLAAALVAATDPVLTLTTRVTDGTNTSTLGSLIKSVTEDHKLTLAADAQVSDGTQTAPFDFQYDADGKKFGAGTAFLQQPAS